MFAGAASPQPPSAPNPNAPRRGKPQPPCAAQMMLLLAAIPRASLLDLGFGGALAPNCLVLAAAWYSGAEPTKPQPPLTAAPPPPLPSPACDLNARGCRPCLSAHYRGIAAEGRGRRLQRRMALSFWRRAGALCRRLCLINGRRIGYKLFGTLVRCRRRQGGTAPKPPPQARPRPARRPPGWQL